MAAASEKVLAFKPEPHSPLTLMKSCVWEANKAFHEADENSGKAIRKIAEKVLKAQQYAGGAGTSFRSLFKPDSPVHFEFGVRHANRYLAVSKNQIVMTHVSPLPGDLSSLAALAQIPPQRLIKLIEDGEVTASISRSQVAALVKKHRPADKKQAAPKTRFNSDQYLHKIETAYHEGAIDRAAMVHFINELVIRCELEGRIK